MINFLNLWTQQIVIALVVTTIIELLLPENKNKKYIKMVIGIYILFNIISPIINNKNILTVDNFNLETDNNITSSTLDQSSMDIRIEKIYIEELEKNVKSKFEENGFAVIKCNIDAQLDTNKKDAGIHLIEVKIRGPANEIEIETIKDGIVEEYEIDKNKIEVKVK